MAASLKGGRLSFCRQGRKVCAAHIPGTAFASGNGLAVAPGPCARSFQPLVEPVAFPWARGVAMRAASEVVEASAPEVVTDKPVEPPSTPQAPIIKVSKTGTAKLVAGSVAAEARKGNSPDVVCVGPIANNIGVKAITIARSLLAADKIDVSFRASFGEVGRTEDDKPLTGVVLKVTQTPSAPAPAAAEGEIVEMHVRREGKHQLIAGALAARVREQKAVCLTAVGPAAVYVAVRTLAKAQEYLAQDSKGLRAVPQFVKVTTGDKEGVAMRLDVVVESA